MHAVTGNAASPPAARGRLLRVFGLVFALAIAIGSTIGGGILRTPGDIAALLPSVPLYLAVWILGGVNALLGATAYAELGTMMPCAGGPYVFARRALGDFAGFFVGYMNWLQDCTTNAALSLLVAEYTIAFVPALYGHSVPAAFLIYATLVAVQWRQVRWGGHVQTFTSLAKTIALGGLVVAAFVWPHPAAAPGAAHLLPHGGALLVALALAMQGVIFTYSGYHYAVFFGEELHDPGRQIPRSLFYGLALIIGMYLLLNAAYLWVIPIAHLAHDPFAGATVARTLFGARGDSIIRAIVIVSILGTINVSVLSSARVLLSMGRDRLFLRQATAVNAGGTPTVATFLSTLVVFAFLLSGTFNAALQVAVAFVVAQYLLMFVTLILLRRREPEAPRPYRAWGYPWTTAVGIVIAAAFLAGVALNDTRHTLIALAVLAVSYPLYRLTLRPRRGARR
ncbi:MAG: APC family permease [Gammaproteobacteria bacterium]|nr:APC family permease [Gammaproteobacteria bacterium]